MYEYFGKKVPTITRLLSKYDDDTVTLHIKGERFKKHSAYEVELMLKIPKKSFVATEDSHTLTKAIDLAKDRLMMQVKKHFEVLHKGKRSEKVKIKSKTA